MNRAVAKREDTCFATQFHRLSHDLRTPLNQINGFAELLSLDESLAGHQREYALAIVSACGALTSAVLAHLETVEHKMSRDDRSRR